MCSFCCSCPRTGTLKEPLSLGHLLISREILGTKVSSTRSGTAALGILEFGQRGKDSLSLLSYWDIVPSPAAAIVGTCAPSSYR